ncbi:hypothetical protein AN958_09725 [Leucoagaricus sp. SymC.cos]|nr:hypothetical protein AN958_09725 [Leucoagaricus sp. SymC.cos]
MATSACLVEETTKHVLDSEASTRARLQDTQSPSERTSFSEALCNEQYSIRDVLRHEEFALIRQNLLLLDTETDPSNYQSSQRAALLRRLNVIQSPIGKLPSEILSHIFQLLCSYPDGSDPRSGLPTLFSPVELGMVSSRWKDVAWTTPNLWTCLTPSDQPTGRRCNPSRVQLYLENSRELPLQLSFSYWHEYWSRQPPWTIFHISVDHILLRNLWRIHTLVLDEPPLKSRWFDPDILEKMKNLVHLTLSVCWSEEERPRGELRLDRLESLRGLALSGEQSQVRSIYKVPFSITSLDLCQLPVDLTTKIILKCHHLVEVHVRLSDPPYNELDEAAVDSWFRHRVTFASLEVMEWEESRESAWDAEFLGCISTPILQNLTFFQRRGLGDGGTRFFRQASTVLSTLELHHTRDMECFRELYNPSSSIENLILHVCETKAWIEVVSLLMPSASVANSVKPIPKLRMLKLVGLVAFSEIRGWQVIQEMEPVYFEPLLPMLSRRLSRGDHFTLDISKVIVDWTPKVQAGLLSLVASGIGLEIVENGYKADWLNYSPHM